MLFFGNWSDMNTEVTNRSIMIFITKNSRKSIKLCRSSYKIQAFFRFEIPNKTGVEDMFDLIDSLFPTKKGLIPYTSQNENLLRRNRTDLIINPSIMNIIIAIQIFFWMDWNFCIWMCCIGIWRINQIGWNWTCIRFKVRIIRWWSIA